MTTADNMVAQARIDPATYIGKQCRKTTHGAKSKPFKSGLQVNTIRALTTHPTLQLPAFLFEEDDSCVEMRRCHVLETSHA
jgi:hypothetical protein